MNVFVFCLLCSLNQEAWAAGTALRFFGSGTNDIDRVKIRIDDPANDLPGPPADVGATDFTLELWLRGFAADNLAPEVTCGENLAWISGNIFLDRDRFNQDRKFGASLADGRVVFGVSGDGTGDRTICGTTHVLDGAWHHIALQRRRSDGWMWLYVDGVLEAEADGPDGDVSYPDDGIPGNFCDGPCTDSDPFLVLGAEKHDAGASFPSFSGWLDEIRMSTVLRYDGAFRPVRRPFLPDANTAALYHLDAGEGDVVFDTSGAVGGPSHGERRFGGSPAGPLWVAETAPLVAPSFLGLRRIAEVAKPLAVRHPGDGSRRLFVVSQRGRIFVLQDEELLAAPFLDLSAQVTCCGERGLLGLAFHPDYETNGFFYVDYTDGEGDTVVSRFQVSAADPNLADPTSEQVLLQIDQPFGNHNAGDLHFGPDGFLYVATGDGGSGGDPQCNGQKLDTLLGKILRLDVDGGDPFAIPTGNPFVGDPAARSEIWSYGLRNPFRFSFDRLTGDLFIGDVGQNNREEVDFQPADGSGGENYGWNRMEGTTCYTGLNNPDENLACPMDVPPCFDPSFTGPIADYDHSAGDCSVTGGYRYRGQRFPDLFGAYLFADFCTGKIWQARPGDSGDWSENLLIDTPLMISSFGENSVGEIYFTHLPTFGTANDDAVWRLVGVTFSDVGASDPFWPAVEALVARGITSGCGSDRYCPNDGATRGQMAVFLTLAIHGPEFLPPPPAGLFSDVPPTHPFARFIEQLAADGLTVGCGGGRFCPDDPVSRWQMAVFLVRALEGPQFEPPPATGIFDDVPTSRPYAPHVEWIFSEGISAGCATAPRLFCPDEPVLRKEMAAFLTRAFALQKP